MTPRRARPGVLGAGRGVEKTWAGRRFRAASAKGPHREASSGAAPIVLQTFCNRAALT
ncbi:hypothetical protein GCM10017600_34750 [Streptosporangium carneum]|uniref:Uncharacterized protein n=1 Tax=Streptosporangium carneum TaxID=47481 RepID=A0A9W6I318_9ACTN|nr:hypothetical protein GCM10017600_34750 [Streptosporangium carneum]